MGKKRSLGDCIFQWMPLGLGMGAMLIVAMLAYGAIILQHKGGQVDNTFIALGASVYIATIGLPLIVGTISFLKSRINTKFTFNRTYKFKQQ